MDLSGSGKPQKIKVYHGFLPSKSIIESRFLLRENHLQNLGNYTSERHCKALRYYSG